MKRSDIIRSIQVRFKNMRATDASAILDTISDHMIESVANGDRIEIRGFGRFKIKPRKERIARNPRSGESVTIPAGLKPVFEPSKELKKLLEESNDIDGIQKELSKIHD